MDDGAGGQLKNGGEKLMDEEEGQGIEKLPFQEEYEEVELQVKKKPFF